MSVIIRKKVKFGDQISEIESYQPLRVISKEERIRADRLDEILMKQIPQIAIEVTEEIPNKEDIVKKWHLLGVKLRGIVDDREIVMEADIENMLIWQAIWYFLPETMMTQRTNFDKYYSEKQHKRQDHLSLCYELGQFNWEEVNWIKRWSDWHEITARRAIVLDKRILLALGGAMRSLEQYPAKTEMLDILKAIGKKYPVRRLRDTSVFNENEIIDFVSSTVNRIIHANKASTE